MARASIKHPHQKQAKLGFVLTIAKLLLYLYTVTFLFALFVPLLSLPNMLRGEIPARSWFGMLFLALVLLLPSILSIRMLRRGNKWFYAVFPIPLVLLLLSSLSRQPITGSSVAGMLAALLVIAVFWVLLFVSDRARIHFSLPILHPNKSRPHK